MFYYYSSPCWSCAKCATVWLTIFCAVVFMIVSVWTTSLQYTNIINCYYAVSLKNCFAIIYNFGSAQFAKGMQYTVSTQSCFASNVARWLSPEPVKSHHEKLLDPAKNHVKNFQLKSAENSEILLKKLLFLSKLNLSGYVSIFGLALTINCQLTRQYPNDFLA